ncbi:alpha/beta hydrolase [Corticibacter populi]|uniref:Alpha/beta hydrolase n=1 Tax=Corticibacter populi TaxID=1550736 RepID=A0A3M6QZ74_9BURK|nr:alpha/beta hydrolase [Corticibacter populi]RMX08320.1 alpha/beta hydrolase [Corticibacter populi]RZS35606.1 pimeloyl-ACP methyl ester carboxylesterase [Corticibacter populi]
MRIELPHSSLFAYTAGKPLRPEQPTMVFIHGVLNDHSVWILQSRYFAHHGWNVLAIDLPGHGKSSGTAPATVEDAAQGVIELLDAAGCPRAALVGHSMGSLIALETAARLGARTSHLALLGGAAPMRVSPTLLDWSLNDPEKALHMVNVFSRSTLSAPPSALGPGTWTYGMGMALGRRILRSNPHENIFHKGFVACDRYAGATQAIARVRAPTLILSGRQDQMTPARAVQPLLEAARMAGVPVHFEDIACGHNMMTEAPEQTLATLREFLATPST